LLDVICVVHMNEADSLLNLNTNANPAVIAANGGNIQSAYNTFWMYLSEAVSNTSIDGTNNSLSGAYDNVTTDIFGLDLDTYIPGVRDGAVSFYSEYLSSVAVYAASPTQGFVAGTKRTVTEAEARFGTLATIRTDYSTQTGLPNFDLYIAALNNGSTTEPTITATFSGWGIGAGLTSQQLTDLHTYLQAFMAARGITT